jgi:hypothetical protein
MRLQRHRGCDRGQQPRGGTEHGADRAVAEQAGSQRAWISDASRGLVGALDENDDDAGSRDRRDRPGRSYTSQPAPQHSGWNRRGGSRRSRHRFRSRCHALVEQHADQDRERVAAEQIGTRDTSSSTSRGNALVSWSVPVPQPLGQGALGQGAESGSVPLRHGREACVPRGHRARRRTVRAPGCRASRRAIGPQGGRAAEGEVPVVGDELEPEPRGLRAGQHGRLGDRRQRLKAAVPV